MKMAIYNKNLSPFYYLKPKKEEIGKFVIDEIWHRKKEKRQKKNLSGY